ncbi:hypothetical protein ECATCC700728_5166 [Escherichia coli ATCC 700728]|nr:hypothetical protein ECATCC700728_5166 [Escherichia coli ATCC 700728]
MPCWRGVPLTGERTTESLIGKSFENIPDHLRPLTSEEFSDE